MTGEQVWPVLLGRYEAAIAAYENASRAITTAMTQRNPSELDFDALVVAEVNAKDAVMLARMRLISHWRQSQTEIRESLSADALARAKSSI